jgi:hypothetical protein
MELGAVIQALYDSEINCSISSFWDGGFMVKLGDEYNGFEAVSDHPKAYFFELPADR